MAFVATERCKECLYLQQPAARLNIQPSFDGKRRNGPCGANDANSHQIGKKHSRPQRAVLVSLRQNLSAYCWPKFQDCYMYMRTTEALKMTLFSFSILFRN